MYLDGVMIDYLDPDGGLTTWNVRPNESSDSVVVDKLTDIVSGKGDGRDAGGVRIYNSDSCVITKHETHLRRVSSDDHTLSFQFEHIGVPLTRGLYHLVLPVGFRLTEFRVIDPYDYYRNQMLTLDELSVGAPGEMVHEENFEEHDELQHTLNWDTVCNTQLARMEMRSNHGSFSFIISGEAELYEPSNPEGRYVSCHAVEDAVGAMFHLPGPQDFLDEGGQERLSEDLAGKIDWIVLQPQIFGIGVNLNAIIEDAIERFKRSVGNDKD